VLWKDIAAKEEKNGPAAQRGGEWHWEEGGRKGAIWIDKGKVSKGGKYKYDRRCKEKEERKEGFHRE